MIWENNFGVALGLSDDSVSNQTFGTFAFPFAGTTYTALDVLSISSNGFVSLGGNNGNDCCGGDVSEFLNDPFPRISVLWLDINPSSAGDVYLNTFNDDADPAIDRLVVTWDSVLFDNGQAVTAQLQLFEDGTIVMGYLDFNLSGFDDDTLIGVTPANGAANPGASDLSNTPFNTGSVATVYELFTGSPPPFDFAQTNIVFTPNGQGGFIVSDNVLNAEVPEPTSLAIWGVGSLGAAWLARRGRRNKTTIC